MSEQTPAAGAAPKRRWVKPVLIISLALNLLFVGLIAGSIWKKRYGPREAGKHRALEATIVQIIKEFPAERRANAEDVLARLRSEVLPRAAGRRAIVKRVVKALKADPYSEEELASALTELRKLRADVQLGMHTLSIELVRPMTVQERHRVLEIYRSKRRAGHWYGRWRRHAQ